MPSCSPQRTRELLDVETHTCGVRSAVSRTLYSRKVNFPTCSKYRTVRPTRAESLRGAAVGGNVAHWGLGLGSPHSTCSTAPWALLSCQLFKTSPAPAPLRLQFPGPGTLVSRCPPLTSFRLGPNIASLGNTRSPSLSETANSPSVSPSVAVNFPYFIFLLCAYRNLMVHFTLMCMYLFRLHPRFQTRVKPVRSETLFPCFPCSLLLLPGTPGLSKVSA